MVEVGKYYHLRDQDPNSTCYPYAKVLEIIPPRTGKNNTNRKVAKCEWTVRKDDEFGFIKYFFVGDMIPAKD